MEPYREERLRSGQTASLWHDGAPAPPITWSEPADTGVCVVGAGIAGLTTAYLLALEGVAVTVIDEKPVGGGETGRTTAHLASALDDRFANLEKRHGLERTRLHFQSHAAAIDRIETAVRAERIGCDFARVDGLLFPGESNDLADLDEEYGAAVRVGVPGVERTTAALLNGGPVADCVRFPGQARFHPLKYLYGLADACRRRGVRFASGRVKSLSGDGPVRAELADGRTINADAGVAATNVPSPISNWVAVYTKMAPYRSYVVAFDARAGSVRDALVWDMEDPYHYVRIQPAGERDVVIVGGADHKAGHGPGDGKSPFAQLEAWARERYPGLGVVTHHWSGQVSEPVDGVAFIGRVPTGGHGACYAITGDSGMGMTHGTLGAMLVADLIRGRENPWTGVYDPDRGPAKGVGEFVRENLDAAGTLREYLTPGEARSADDVAPGAGALVRDGLRKLAVYKDPQGTVHRCSAVCPHLKCIVRWNETEASWDCPCHGSRFDAYGRWIMGPAVDDLEQA